MKLPVHRWFRYSAGFSAEWILSELQSGCTTNQQLTVLDPFAGSATTLIAAEQAGVRSIGIEAHPFIARVARAKLLYRTCPADFCTFARGVLARARKVDGSVEGYPSLVSKCYEPGILRELDSLRSSLEETQDASNAWLLTWLSFVGILRAVSHAGTAPWQYVLPNRTSKTAERPFQAFANMVGLMADDMDATNISLGPPAKLLEADARTCQGVADASIDLVLTSPPYANNYDYADATRLELSVLREISGWGDLQDYVRRHLVRSCSQHVTERSVDLNEVLNDPVLLPIRAEIDAVCRTLADVRLTRGGRKTYHLMIATYFQDMSRVWQALRRVCKDGARVCFVLGDSAPYGVYVPVIEWNGALAAAAGFKSWRFDKIRDRNVKWENRKHRVPLCEGRLWVDG